MSARLQKIALDKLTARTCRESYYHFFLEAWPTVIAEKLKLNWHIKYLCDELQIIAERVFRDEPKEYDFICNCPPGTSKSSIFSVFFQPWVWTRMPSARFITGSYAERLALDLSRKSRDVIMSDWYRALFPEIVLREDQNTKGYFVNTQGGIRYAVGVGGSVIGMHAHFLTVDDPMDPQGALSSLILAEANTWMTETLSQRKIDKQLSPTMLVMQRLHQDDPTGYWLDKGGRLKHLCLPCDNTWEIKPSELAAKYTENDNGLLDPVRFPKIQLQEEEQRLGPTGYAGQYGQQPTPRGGAMFRVDRFQIAETTPGKWKRGPVRFWDKAATSGGSGSFTVGIKMALDLDDRIWVLDMVRDRWESGRREKEIINTAKSDGRACRIGIEQEPGGGGKEAAEKAARSYSMAGYRCYIDVVRATKEERAGAGNENRADTYSVQVNTSNVTLLHAPWNKTFIEEHRFFPNSRFKDIVDAAAGAYAMISKQRLRIGAL